MTPKITIAPPKRKDGHPLIHNLRHYSADPLKFWLDTGQMAPLIRVQVAHRNFWVVTDANMFQHILQTKARSYPRGKQLLEPDGLHPHETVFNAPTWDDWLWRRRLLQPAFHHKQLALFATSMVSETVTFINKQWQADTTIPLKTEMKTLTMNIIARTMFTAQLNDADLLAHCFEVLSQFNRYRSATIITPPIWIPLPLYRRARTAARTRHQLVQRLVSERMASGQPQDDLLDMLISANLEDGTKFSPEHIVHEMNSIIFAGHETTAMTLTWIFCLLAQYPDVEQTIRAEIDSVLGKRLPTLNDLDAMPYTHWVIQETLRLYPPVYVTLRQSLETDELGGYHVPVGTEFLMNIRGLHRDKRYWQQPNQFNPERFHPEQAKIHHKSAYVPFILGPRKCIGDAFAMMEMRLIVPTILQQWQFQATNSTPPEIPGFIMEPKGNVPIKIAPIVSKK